MKGRINWKVNFIIKIQFTIIPKNKLQNTKTIKIALIIYFVFRRLTIHLVFSSFCSIFSVPLANLH